MTTSKLPQNGTNLLQTALAKPYHYRRAGRFYLRLRPQGTTLGFFTLSLRTTDKATAMTISQDILKTLKAFHLDNPKASWEELRERLVDIAENALTMAHGDSSLVAYEMIHDEQIAALREASAKLPLSVNQQRAVGKAVEVLEAAQERLQGSPGKLVEIIRGLKGESRGTSVPLAFSLSVSSSQDPLSWSKLSTLYMAEHSINLKESSRKAALTTHTVIGGAFEAIGVTDLRAHTREDLIALREKLLEGRKASTVNNLLAKLKAVMDWAVRSDKLTKTYTDKLKITKGADSDREAFTRNQVVALMDHAKSLPATSWERWALSLLAITGARVGEVSYLTNSDIKEVDGLWCIDINEDISEGGDDEKSIKNKHSARKVPLVDGALGFDLQAFLQAVQAGALPSAQGIKPARASQRLNVLLKEVLGMTKQKNQTLHSLRHHLVSSMQIAGVELQFMQAVAGHASRTITLDAYGSSVPVRKLAEAIQRALIG